MYQEFEGKVAVVSGAAQGIGAAIGQRLRQAGAHVAELDIRFDSDGDNGRYRVDISDATNVDHTIHAVERTMGPIDYLVHSAGILRMGRMLDTRLEDWLATFAVNTTGAFNLVQAVGRKMRARRSGAMVAVSSNAATVPRIAMGSYAASKAALTQMMKCLGLELAEDNIRCNVVAPGSTDTEMQRQLWTGNSGAEQVIKGSLDNHRLGIPLRRIADPDQIAELVVFLLSDKAAHITLESIVVDGGATLGS